MNLQFYTPGPARSLFESGAFVAVAIPGDIIRDIIRLEAQGVDRESVITCPECGANTRAEMPLDACQFFYECPVCTSLLRPKAGDCCVFCSYGSVPCPPRTDCGCTDSTE